MDKFVYAKLENNKTEHKKKNPVKATKYQLL